ncbi:MAG: PEGA domain-containing protein [Chlorobiota bacterium]|nr:MAG: PEGA domain-containing protein [Chlorobiota bacterium]
MHNPMFADNDLKKYFAGTEMKRILLFILILAIQLFPQLKELEVKPTENRGGIPIFRDHPDKAGIIFYTQFDDLKFYSSYGIVEIKGDPAGGKYVVIIEAVPRQTIEVRAPGFKTEMIRLESLQPRDVFYYEVLPKKQEGIEGIPELGVTINATPTDAKIFIDGESVVNLKTKKIKVGSHRLRIEREGFATSDELVEVGQG